MIALTIKMVPKNAHVNTQLDSGLVDLLDSVLPLILMDLKLGISRLIHYQLEALKAFIPGHAPHARATLH